MKKTKLIIVFAAILFLLSSCVPGDGSSTIDDPSGFFSGIWHGWIAPVTLIWGIFNDAIRIYEPMNTGWWYDFGYYIAIIGGFGGLSFFRKKTKDD